MKGLTNFTVAVLTLSVVCIVNAQRPGGMSDDELQAEAAGVKMAIGTGLIKLGCGEHKAWIDTELWHKETVFNKDKISYVLLLMCASETGSTAKRQQIDIFDLQSGEKLKSYSVTLQSGTSVIKPSDPVADQTKSDLPEIFSEQSQGEDESSWWDTAPTPSASVAKRQSFNINLNKRFRLGDLSYRIRRVGSGRGVGAGVESVYSSAPQGNQYVVVHYEIQNEGREAQQGSAADFSQNFELRSEDKQFLPDATATTALAISNNLNAVSLPPGASGNGVVVFTVSDQVAGGRFRLAVSEKHGSNVAILRLIPRRLNSAKSPKAKSAHASNPESFRPGNSQYEEMRREMLLNRPPGTSSTDYDPDWH